MAQSEFSTNPSSWLTKRIDSSHLLWLLSPMAYPIVYWLSPRVSEGIGAAIGVFLLFVLPGWLLHLLINSHTPIGLAARISRAFVLSISIISIIGLAAWFCGGDTGLGAVEVGNNQPPPITGRLSTILWGVAIYMLSGGVFLVIRAALEVMKTAKQSKIEAGGVGDAGNRGGRKVVLSKSGVVSKKGVFSGDGHLALSTDADEAENPGESGENSGRSRARVSDTYSSEVDNPVMQRIFREAYRLGDQHKLDHPVAPRWATLLVLGMMVLAASLLCFYTGGASEVFSDAPDHIATIREMVEQNRILPRTYLHLEGDGSTLDARKGFFHVAVAALAQLTRMDPWRLWQLLPGLLIPFVVIVFHTFARKLLRSEGTALFATFLALIVYGNATQGLFIRLAYGSRMGEILSWAVLAIALEYIFKHHNRRILWVMGLAAFGATAVHVFSGLLILFSLGVYFALMFFVRGPRHPAWKRTGEAVLICSIGCLVPILWRILYAGDQTNPIHTHDQGLLFFTDQLYMITPREWMMKLKGVGFGGILMSLFLWRRAKDDDAVLYLVGLSLVPVLIVANPLIVPWLEPALGYLIARFVLAIPFFMVLAYMARSMGESLLDLNSVRRIVVALVFYVFMVLLLFPQLESFANSYSTANKEEKRACSMHVLEGSLKTLHEQLDEPAVILSDPLTSYSIPALTHHRIVGTLHQHSTPSDSTALDRLAACRDVLSPYLGAGEKARHCRRFHVDYVFVNGDVKPTQTFYCKVNQEIAAKQIEELAKETALFIRRDEIDLGPGSALFEVRKENLDALAGIVTSGQNRLVGRTTEEMTRSILLRELPGSAQPVARDTIAGIVLAAVELDSTWVSRGEHVELTLYWQVVKQTSDFPVESTLTLDGLAPRDRFWRYSWSKVHRRIQQRQDGICYRIRRSYRILDGMFGVEHWPRDRFIVDRVSIRINDTCAIGEYELKVFWCEQMFLPNMHVTDLLQDQDSYNRQTIGLVEVY